MTNHLGHTTIKAAPSSKGFIFSESPEARELWIRRLQSRGYNHFTCYRDTQGVHALMFTRSENARHFVINR